MREPGGLSGMESKSTCFTLPWGVLQLRHLRRSRETKLKILTDDQDPRIPARDCAPS